MAEARKMGKTELFAHFVEHFAAVDISLKRADAREFFEELQRVRATASGLRRVHAARHREARLTEARSADRSQPSNRASHRNPAQAGGQGSHREAAQGRRAPRSVTFRPDNRREWSTGPARLPCCSAPRAFVARRRGQASSSCTRDGERNRQATAPARWPAARSSCRSGKLAAVSVTTKAKSTGVDSGRRTWPLTGMMELTCQVPNRRALFSGCAPASAGLTTGTASAPTGVRLLPEPGNPGQLGAVSFSAVAQGPCRGCAAGVDRRPDRRSASWRRAGCDGLDLRASNAFPPYAQRGRGRRPSMCVRIDGVAGRTRKQDPMSKSGILDALKDEEKSLRTQLVAIQRAIEATRRSGCPCARRARRRRRGGRQAAAR